MTYTLSDKTRAVLEYLERLRRFGYNTHSVGMRGISTARVESHRLSEPRSDLLIPGLAGASSFEESAR